MTTQAPPGETGIDYDALAKAAYEGWWAPDTSIAWADSMFTENWRDAALAVVVALRDQGFMIVRTAAFRSAAEQDAPDAEMIPVPYYPFAIGLCASCRDFTNVDKDICEKCGGPTQ